MYLVATGRWARRPERLAQALRTAASPGDETGTGRARIVGRSHTVVTDGAGAGPPATLVQRAGRALFVDGCVTTWPSTLDGAVDVDDLWERLRSDECGQFVGVSLDLDTGRLELRTDPVGFRQAYCVATDDGWLISDSVLSLAALLPSPSMDPTGVATFLAMGWPAGDATLVDGVRVLPAASTFTWTAGAAEPERRIGDRFALVRADRPARFDADLLRHRLGDACEGAGRQFDLLRCALTGGRDSRVLLSLALERSLPVECFVDGDPRSEEIAVSRELAALAGVPHRVAAKPPQLVIDRWDDLATTLLRRTSGMVSLWQAADVLPTEEAPAGSELILWGIGGEIARGFVYDPMWWFMHKSVDSVSAYLADRTLRGKEALLRPDCLATARRYLGDFVVESCDAGVALTDCVDVAFKVVEMQRRKSASKANVVPHGTLLYAPFVTPPVVRAALGLHPHLRYAEHIHYRLLQADPALWEFPFFGEPWRVQLPWLVLAQRGWRRFVSSRLRRAPSVPTHQQRAVLAAVLPELRGRILDAASSQLWDHVDRSSFERVTAAGAPRSERLDHLVFLAETVRMWEDELRRSSPRAAV